MTIIANLYFSIVVLAFIVLVDVFVKFKNPPSLKFFFLLLPFSITLIALINATSAINFVFYLAPLKTCMAVAILNIFSILYFPKFKTGILIITTNMLLFTIFLILVNNNIIAQNAFTERFRVVSIDENLNVKITPLVRFIRFSFLFFVALNIGYFWYVIYTKHNLNNIYYEKIKGWTTLIFILCCIVILMNILIGFTSNREIWVNSLTIFILYFILLLVLKRPNFLNHSAIKIAFGQKFNIDPNAIIDDNAFNEAFYNNSYFTNSEASLENLSKLLKVNSGELSAFVQLEYQLTFNELVNKNRVSYFLDIVQDPQFQNFTIDALAKKVGFSSRQHLHKPFKKFHGGNPSDLMEATNRI
jgi:AraC-like DNA-binding protein